MIHVVCPNCHSPITVPQTAADREFRCPECWASVGIPAEPPAHGVAEPPSYWQPAAAAEPATDYAAAPIVGSHVYRHRGPSLGFNATAVAVPLLLIGLVGAGVFVYVIARDRGPDAAPAKGHSPESDKSGENLGKPEQPRLEPSFDVLDLIDNPSKYKGKTNKLRMVYQRERSQHPHRWFVCGEKERHHRRILSGGHFTRAITANRRTGRMVSVSSLRSE
jgi:hypothetical protein